MMEDAKESGGKKKTPGGTSGPKKSPMGKRKADMKEEMSFLDALNVDPSQVTQVPSNTLVRELPPIVVNYRGGPRMEIDGILHVAIKCHPPEGPSAEGVIYCLLKDFEDSEERTYNNVKMFTKGVERGEMSVTAKFSFVSF